MRVPILVLVAVVLAAMPSGASEKQTGVWPSEIYSWSVHFDNDLFVRTDRYYTNGIRLSVLSEDIEAMDLPPWAEQVYGWCPLFGRDGYTNNIGLAVGQNMYTPRDITIAGPQPGDHPWGGWLYGAVSLHHRDSRNLHKLELRLGVVGPESLAEDAQRLIHRVRQLDMPEGWDNQLGTEPGVWLGYTYKRRAAHWGYVGGWSADLIPDAGITLGNIRIDANVGATLRAGWRVPLDFHSLRIDESGYAAARSEDLAGGWRGLSVYTFAGLRGYAVGHDLFLDGNTFRGGPSVTRRPLVAAAEFGVGVRWGRLRVVYAQVARTREFAEQDSGQQFGSINATWFF